jgi:hypothetical protein
MRGAAWFAVIVMGGDTPEREVRQQVQGDAPPYADQATYGKLLSPLGRHSVVDEHGARGEHRGY